MAGRPHEDGERLLSEIGSAWSTAQQHWQDDMASHFGRLHWTPLVDESHAYLRALSECMELLSTAERETEY
jgi:hypothetical protein